MGDITRGRNFGMNSPRRGGNNYQGRGGGGYSVITIDMKIMNMEGMTIDVEDMITIVVAIIEDGMIIVTLMVEDGILGGLALIEDGIKQILPTCLFIKCGFLFFVF